MDRAGLVITARALAMLFFVWFWLEPAAASELRVEPERFGEAANRLITRDGSAAIFQGAGCRPEPQATCFFGAGPGLVVKVESGGSGRPVRSITIDAVPTTTAIGHLMSAATALSRLIDPDVPDLRHPLAIAKLVSDFNRSGGRGAIGTAGGRAVFTLSSELDTIRLSISPGW